MSTIGRRTRQIAELPVRWGSLIASRPEPPPARVWYGRRVPRSGAEAAGGLVKFQRLQESIPNETHGFNVIYLGSNTMPPDARGVIAFARLRGIPIVWNQDGVAYEAWQPRGWRGANARMARGLHAAAHVFFQSEFCRASAERFLGLPAAKAEVLYNPVDTARFAPSERSDRPPTLLLGGNQYERYRLETALLTLTHLPDVHLRIAGRLSWTDERRATAWALNRVRALGLEQRVHFVGPYAQRDAPAVIHDGDVLLHTKVNDPCPGAVVEAMACGLPVVYSATGGTPELVGSAAGVGVEQPLDYERIVPPDAEALADAASRVFADLDRYARAARERAVERFDLQPWVQRHRKVFEAVLR